MPYSCFCVELLCYRIIESAASNPDPSGFFIYKSENIKNHRENQKTKEPKRSREKLAKNLEKTNTQNTTFRPMSPKPNIGLKVLFFHVFFGILDAFCEFFPWPVWFFCFCWFSLWFLIFSTGFKGKPVRRRIRLHIFSLLHPLFLTKGLLISQRVAHSQPLDLNIYIASETCGRLNWKCYM